jgi:hypothetical protein
MRNDTLLSFYIFVACLGDDGLGVIVHVTH